MLGRPPRAGGGAPRLPRHLLPEPPAPGRGHAPADPPYDEACWAAPHEQAEAPRDYLATYSRNRPPRAAGTPLLTDTQLIALAKDRLRGDTSVRLATIRSGNGAADA